MAVLKPCLWCYKRLFVYICTICCYFVTMFNSYTACFTHVKISQPVNKMCSRQACHSQPVTISCWIARWQQIIRTNFVQVFRANKLVASLLQVCHNFATSLEQEVWTQLGIGLLEHSCSKSAAGLSQLVHFYVCTIGILVLIGYIFKSTNFIPYCILSSAYIKIKTYSINSLVEIVPSKFAGMCGWPSCVFSGDTRQTLLAVWYTWSASCFAVHKVVFMSKVH